MATISNVQPVYPNGIFPWTDKVDNSDIDFAANINSIAAEVESVELTVGTTPNVEPSPPTGLPLTYGSVSNRITDAMSNAQLPYSALLATNVSVNNYGSGSLAPFTVGLDPYSCYNGNDITIPVNGWWLLTSESQWAWSSNGYSHVSMTLNGSSSVLDEYVLDWEFAGNVLPLSYTADGQPITNPPSGSAPPRWQQFGTRPIKVGLSFQGPLHAGDRVSVYLENGTAATFQTIVSMNLHAFMMRTIPPTTSFVSG